MITLYFADVDDAGHGFGPDAPETRAAVLKVDANLERLLDGLKRRKIAEKVNLIVTSDHGMAAYKMRDAVVLDDYFDAGDAERIFWVGEFTQIFPKPGKEDLIYNQIKAKLPPTAEIYRRGEFPARFKFGKNPRIAPIVVIPKEGAIISNRERYKTAANKGLLDKTRGGHGYDNTLDSMKAVFIARGAAFKKRKTVEPFENIEIYNIMCAILGLKPAENDGDFEKVRYLLK
jgi:predicted AlkP superfamily pyrophosphatase or phosphodiesterase